MIEKNAKVLAEKYKNGTCTPEERALVEQWYGQLPASERQSTASQIQYSMDSVWGAIQKEITPNRSNWRPYVAAASLLATGFLALWYYTNSTPKMQPSTADALPGRDEAILTLSTGQSVHLSQAHTGISFQEEEIKYTDGTRMTNTISLPTTPSGPFNYVIKSELNTIEAPLGGNYRVVLSDGSIVWLNSGSKLTFPSVFDQSAPRQVSLSGEAFFAVSKDPNRRFSVKTRDQQINVLGTKFNVESYPDQLSSKTTLVEGAVEIVNVQAGQNYGKTIILKPNEQSELNNQGFTKTTTNTAKAVAWKDGLFIFNDDPLKDIMAILSRWYKVEVDYNSLPNNHFNGHINKDVKLSQVLEMLEITGNSTFKLENNCIKAYPKENKDPKKS